jgi:predicted NBD/HSP70 family sugar kinase
MTAKLENSLQRAFREVSQHGEVSVSSLARLLGLRSSSVLEKVRPLVTKGILAFRDRHTRIGINPEFGHVVGIDLGASHLYFALADFGGEILGDSTVKIRPEDGPQKLVGEIKDGARSLAVKAGHGRLRAVGISVPSAVDAERGVVAFANNLPGWKDIHLGRELEKEFRVPVFLENDANLAAIGERWRGVARGVSNFVFIAIGTGIGSGIFVDGKLYRGHSGWAGELFRMNVDWQRWSEDFKDTGLFENYVSGMGIAMEGRKVLAMPAAIAASGLAQERDAYFVFQSFHEGIAEARAVLEKIFTMLGVGIANVVAVLEPDLIVLGGGITKGAPEFMLATVEKVVRAIQKDHSPPVKLSALEDKAQTFGAIYSAITAACEAIARSL